MMKPLRTKKTSTPLLPEAGQSGRPVETEAFRRGVCTTNMEKQRRECSPAAKGLELGQHHVRPYHLERPGWPKKVGRELASACGHHFRLPPQPIDPAEAVGKICADHWPGELALHPLLASLAHGFTRLIR